MYKYVIGLDLLRFFCAFFVVLFHLGLCMHWPYDYSVQVLHLGGIFPGLSTFAQYGWVGVEVFFTISGYVIAATVKGRSRVQYVRSRFLRLWPTVCVCATLSYFLAAFTNQAPPMRLLLSWVNSMIITPTGPWIDTAYWTLPIEISFYLLVLVFVVGHPENRLKQLAIGLGVFSTALWLGYFLVDSIPDLQAWRIEFNKLCFSSLSNLMLLHHGVFFSIGIGVQCRLGPALLIFLGAPALLAGFVEIGAVVQNNISYLDLSMQQQGPAQIIWIFCLIYLILVSRYNVSITNALSKFQIKTIRWIGSITYPLYLTHVVTAFAAAFLFLKLGIGKETAWILASIVAIVTGAIIATWFEPLARSAISHLIESFLKKRKDGTKQLRQIEISVQKLARHLKSFVNDSVFLPLGSAFVGKKSALGDVRNCAEERLSDGNGDPSRC